MWASSCANQRSEWSDGREASLVYREVRGGLVADCQSMHVWGSSMAMRYNTVVRVEMGAELEEFACWQMSSEAQRDGPDCW